MTAGNCLIPFIASSDGFDDPKIVASFMGFNFHVESLLVVFEVIYFSIRRYGIEYDEVFFLKENLTDWESLPPLNSVKCQSQLSAINNTLFAYGKMNEFVDDLAGLEMFSFELKQWCSLPPLQYERIRGAFIALDGFLYVIGGSRSGSWSRIVEKYNYESNTWHILASLPFAVPHPKVHTSRGLLFVSAGPLDPLPEHDFLLLYRYNCDDDIWTTLNVRKITSNV